jgi:hypothetical protein
MRDLTKVTLHPYDQPHTWERFNIAALSRYFIAEKQQP